MLNVGDFARINHETIKGYGIICGVVPNGNVTRYIVRPLGQKKKIPMFRSELIFVNPFELMDTVILDKHDKAEFKAFMRQFEGEIVFHGEKGVSSKR